MHTPIELIVGLGNPDKQYEYTRHNAGYWFVKELALRAKESLLTTTKFHGLTAQININNKRCWLLLPTTYMNDSGIAVRALADFYKILPENILVVHDELDFPPGTVRLKQDGGHGGHNGLRSIINHLKSKKFYRLRLGIGHPGHKDEVHNYVLGRASKNELEQIISAINQGLNIIPDLLNGEIDKAIRSLHGV